MINDYTSVNLTKLDVLDQLPEIKIGVAYKLNGKVLEGFPGTFETHDVHQSGTLSLRLWRYDFQRI
jgi:adenylosuccinate synthase